MTLSISIKRNIQYDDTQKNDTQLGDLTFDIVTLSIMILSIKILGIKKRESQQSNTQHNDTRCWMLFMLSVELKPITPNAVTLRHGQTLANRTKNEQRFQL